MAKLGKRTAAAREAFAGKDNVSVEEAVSLVRGSAKAKFDETVDIAMHLGVDPRHADQMVRGVVALPNGTGKTVRVAVFAKDAKADEAKEAGADIVGAEDLMEIVQSGKIEFDRCIATPDMMPIVGRLGKVLGPRNLMPNPKVGTVTMDVKAAVEAAKGGEVQFKAEKAGVVHAGVGKASFDEAKLVENVRAFIEAVQKAKPSGAKGTYMKKIAISSTMGPGVSIDVGSATEQHYAGLSVAEMQDFRGRMREAGGSVRVAKNKLAKIALDGTPCESMSDLMTGMTVLAYSEDPVTAAKVVEAFAKDNNKLVVIGGSMGGEALDPAGVKTVAAMPSREELLSQIAGAIGGPASDIAAALGGPASTIASILTTIEERAEAA